MRATMFAVLMLSGAALAAQPASAPAPAPQPKAPADTAALERELAQALIKRDWPKAEEVLRKQIDIKYGKFVPYYNMACVRAVQDDRAGGMEWLLKAVARGFCDLNQMQRDSYLRSLHEEPEFRNLVERWPVFLEKRVDAQVAELRKQFPGKLAEQRDPAMRLVYLTASSDAVSQQVHEELNRVAAWCDAGVFKGLMTDARAERDPWVAIVIPNRDGFMRWAALEYGPDAVKGFAMVGGQYSRDDQQLVSLDAGATLRHEFVHVLHWRDMGRRGQVQPVYIQEGLASLVEDYDMPGEDARAGVKKIVPAVSWRTNAARRREKIGGFIGIDKLAAMTHEKFTGTLPLANYAAARTLFLWLDRQEKLVPWYTHYTEHFAEDPSGVKSFEAVLGAPVAELNKKLRAWMRELPEAPEEIRSGMASLGVEVEVQAGDGVAVVGITVPPDFRGRRPVVLAGEEGELRVNDVIRSLNGRPTRDMAELVRVLGAFKPDEVVEVEVRRGSQLATVKMKLVRK